MHFQFLIEDQSTELLVGHVINKIKKKYQKQSITHAIKSFKGLGHLKTQGSLEERKRGNLLNSLVSYMTGFDKALASMPDAAIVVVLDNDNRNTDEFYSQLKKFADDMMLRTDHVFCIAVREMEAWILGDSEAIFEVYPNARKKVLQSYEQDGICETWEVLANMLYPGGLIKLKKKANTAYTEIGKAKCEWADRIGAAMELDRNESPSFRHFVSELEIRIKE